MESECAILYTDMVLNSSFFFNWTKQRAIFFVPYVEDHDSFVVAKSWTDFHSVITLFGFCFIFLI